MMAGGWWVVGVLAVIVALACALDPWLAPDEQALDPKQVQDLAARERKREQMRAAMRDC